MYSKYTYYIYNVVLIVVLALLPLNVVGQTYVTHEGLRYRIIDNYTGKVYVTAPESGTYSGKIEIPFSFQKDDVENYYPIGIDQNCFNGCTLSSVTFRTMPDFYFSTSCFEGCNITTLDLSYSNTTTFRYANDCFKDCTIGNLIIGENSIDNTERAIWKQLSLATSIGTLTYKHTAGFFSFVTFKDFDFSTATNVEAYYATTASCDALITGTKLQLTKVTGKVPAGTPLFLYAASDQGCTIPCCTTGATTLSDNCLKGEIAQSYTVTASDNIYALSKSDKMLHPVHPEQPETTILILPGLAYLKLPATSASSPTRAIELSTDQDVTGIEEIELGEEPNSIHYDLSGRQTDPLAKGLHIVNGKKIMVR